MLKCIVSWWDAQEAGTQTRKWGGRSTMRRNEFSNASAPSGELSSEPTVTAERLVELGEKCAPLLVASAPRAVRSSVISSCTRFTSPACLTGDHVLDTSCATHVPAPQRRRAEEPLAAPGGGEGDAAPPRTLPSRMAVLSAVPNSATVFMRSSVSASKSCTRRGPRASQCKGEPAAAP